MTDREIIEKYENLVYGIAFKKNRPDLFNDLIQEGFMALCHANRCYKEKRRGKKACLITYLRRSVHNNMNKYINLNDRIGLDAMDIDDLDVAAPAEHDNYIRRLLRCVRSLSPNIRFIITKSFNLDGSGMVYGEQIGRELGISQVRVSQLKRKGLERLKVMLKRRDK
jgi:RNA polymerase sigma factor (sigma-70 family)